MSHHPERTARNVRPVNQPPSKVFNIWRDAHLADCQAFCEKFLMALTSIDKTISHSTQAIIRAKFCMPGVDAAGVQ